jgi:tryptophan synthase beta chain
MTTATTHPSPATSLSPTLTPAADPAGELRRLLDGTYPDSAGRFGPFGGRFVPETLIPAVTRLERVAREALNDPAFQQELATVGRDWIGRSTPLMRADNLSKAWGIDLWFKREDLAHTGAHKINNALGQGLLARRLGSKRIIAETGAGQHGVATAAACARLGFPCRVYMGAQDVERQSPNVQRMKRFGAEVVPVTTGDQTLRAAIDEALRDWVADPIHTHYLLGSAVGPHPFPLIVRTFQSVIGREARAQFVERNAKLPDAVFACVGGGSNAIGFFHGFIGDPSVKVFGVEAGGRGPGLHDHSATITRGRPGVLHGCYTMLLQDANGQIIETHSISAGLDYPGVGPEHSFLHWIGRVEYIESRDDETLVALNECCRSEGILPALEPSHALAAIKRWARDNQGKSALVNMCGRGDKDMPILTAHAPM